MGLFGRKKKDVQNGRDEYNKGYALYDLKKYEEAITYFDEATRLDPENASFWIGRSQVFARLSVDSQDQQNNLWKEKEEESLMCFNEATRIEPENAMYWSLKVHSLKLLERYEEALTCNDEVIKLKPTSLAWLIKSELLKKLGRTEEAEQCVTKAKELNLNKS